MSMLEVLILMASMAFLTWAEGQNIRVLKSKLKLSEDGKAISGAKLVENKTVKTKDLTLCIRFNYKLLGGYEGRSRLISIEDWRDGDEVRLH